MKNTILNINNLITSDSITLYWEKPETSAQLIVYQIFLNGSMAGSTDKTHFELKDLEPDTDYEILVNACQEDDQVQISSGMCCIRTEKKKMLLDITAAPYYAVGDGKKLNTLAIQKAIEDCGPGQGIYIPSGVFLTGALKLHSNMELYLEQNAVLQGTECAEDYLPRIKSRFEGIEMECYSSLLNLGNLNHADGYNCRNVVIRGKGTIASGGRRLAEHVISTERERIKEYLTELGDKINECENADTIPGRVRPRLINISNCQNVRISGVTLKNGASWNVHMIYSDRIVTDRCTFRSEGVWNGDGWDPDSSTNCILFGCTFFTGDDSVAIKSGKNPEGNAIGRPCEHIRIFDCRSAYGHGITIGSEMSGGVNDVEIWDCDLGSSLYGIEIKGTKKRGGYVRNIRVRDCTAARILIHSVGYNDDGISAGVPPIFEKCRFEHLHLLGQYLNKEGKWEPCTAVELCGFEKPEHFLKDIVFDDILIGKTEGKQAITLQYCENVSFINISSTRIVYTSDPVSSPEGYIG